MAFEIAQQLEADGEDVESVILIDSYRPGDLSEAPLLKLQSRLQLGVFWLQKNYYCHGGWEKVALLPKKIWQRLTYKCKVKLFRTETQILDWYFGHDWDGNWCLRSNNT